MPMKVRYEEMLPGELREVIAAAPVAYVPLGSLEWHGYHLPVGNDAIKVHEICMRAARVTGGAVLPPLFCGVGGGHKEYFASVMVEEAWIEPLLKRQFDCLARHGFRAIVAVTGHYPGEQVQMVRRAAEAHMAEPGSAKVAALPEYEAFPSDPRRGDHAAKWETSILWHLRPELVEVDRLTDGREDPLYGVFGEDPREHASPELGEETVNSIVEGLARMVRQMLEEG
jgi:creatinine amidohydrolase